VRLRVADAARGLLCVVLVAAAYWRTLGLPHFAEWYFETDRASAGFRLGEVLDTHGRYYRPATQWAQQLWYALGGAEPRPFRDRAIVLALHLGCLALLFVHLRGRCPPMISAATAVGFGIHPSLPPSLICNTAWWTVLVGLLFLVAFGLYEPCVRSPPAGSLAWRGTTAGVVVLLMALVGEPGAAATGAVILWLGLHAWRRRDRRWSALVFLPALLAGAAYASLRIAAMGPASLRAYVERPATAGALLGAWAHNVAYEAAVLLNPLRLPTPDADRHGPAALALFAALGCAPIAAAVAWKPARRVLRAEALPVLALATYALMQMNANWLVVKEPIARAGMDRTYHQYYPVLYLALLAGPILARLSATLGSRGRGVLAATIIAWLAAAFVAQQGAVALGVEGGRLFESDRAALTPFLRTLPAGSAVLPYGIPGALHRPHLPWVWVYYYSRARIFSEWAERPIRVPWPPLGDHSPPEGFRGYRLDRTENGIVWTWEDPEAARAAYLRRQGTAHVPALDVPLDGRSVAGVRQLEVTGAGGTLEAIASGPDPGVTVRVGVEALDYGVLRYELRGWGGGAAGTTVYFRGKDAGFRQSHTLSRSVRLDGRWNEVRFPLFADPRWVASGRIEEIRIDPMERRGPFELRGLRLGNDVAWASSWRAP